MPTRQRAMPLAPEERRKAILDAVIPLLISQGSNVTTAEMAAACGIAEGTIFRVFPDKPSLLHEALKSSFDPAPTLERLANIERALPLEVRLRKAAAIILERVERVHTLASVLRSMPHRGHDHYEETHKAAIEAGSMIFWGLTRMFRDEADRLAVEPARAAAAFRGLLYAVTTPLCDPKELMTLEEAIDILLNGVLREEAS